MLFCGIFDNFSQYWKLGHIEENFQLPKQNISKFLIYVNACKHEVYAAGGTPESCEIHFPVDLGPILRS